MKLSIIIPVYNEEKTIQTTLTRVNSLSIPDVDKEIILIDDGSTDNTSKKIESELKKIKSVKFFKHEHNSGKGAAVRTGFKNATGDYILIQDADLEYDPKDIPKLLKPIQERKTEVVFGTRLKRLPNLSRDERTPKFMLSYLGNKFLSLITSILYGQWITDMETGYKVFPTKSVRNMKLNSRSFEFEPEITSKLLKSGKKIVEVSISTNPRSHEEGKKLNAFTDGPVALWTLLKYRFVD